MANATHVLYTLAEQADARLTETLKSRTGRTRWTMIASDYLIPEVREALLAKLNADEAWLTFMRTTRPMAEKCRRT
jgi:hypothetical protein